MISASGRPGGAWPTHAAASLGQALGMAGDAAGARAAIAVATSSRQSALEPMAGELGSAPAWADGGTTEARSLACRAAELAASRTQPTVELMALHTAVCFGDVTVE